MKLATFNINGIKARIEALPAWLAEAQPDVVCLQEIKSVDEAFPAQVFEGMGYRVETHGQKGFNGVAILSKLPLEDVPRGLPGDADDEQARWIEATVIGARAPCGSAGCTCRTATPHRGRSMTTSWPGWRGWRRGCGRCWRPRSRWSVWATTT